MLVRKFYYPKRMTINNQEYAQDEDNKNRNNQNKNNDSEEGNKYANKNNSNNKHESMTTQQKAILEYSDKVMSNPEMQNQMFQLLNNNNNKDNENNTNTCKMS
jgi:hypothetical protein